MIGTIAEFATVIVADVGISSMGATLMTALTPANAKTFEKVCILAGGTALTGVACNEANKYIHDYYENGKAVIKVLKDRKAKKKEEKEEKPVMKVAEKEEVKEPKEKK